jgi:hypothetical protein
MITTAVNRLSASTLAKLGSMRTENNDGTTSTRAATISRVAFMLAALRSNCWVPCLRPPTTNATPATSNRLPTIEPMIDARTSSSRPARMASTVMMSSAALPSVALSSAPTRGPARAAKSSVASPMMPASGTTARAEVAKINIGLP